MAEITPGDGQPVIDYMARDRDSLLLAMRALIPEKLPAWRDFAGEADFGNVLLELFAHLGDILSYYQDRVANESFLGTARTRRSIIEHLRLIGYQLGTAAPAATVLTVSVRAGVTDVITISPGDAFATRSAKDSPSVRFEYTGQAPLVIDFGAIPVAGGVKVFGSPDGRAGIPVEQGRQFTDEVIGSSTGAPDQRFAIVHPQVIRRPAGAQQASRDVAVNTRLGAVTLAWQLVDTLAFSTATDQHFTLEIDENDQATVIFGDGTFGAVPPTQASVLATYRTGGGQLGNVPPGAINTVVDAPPLALRAATVTNLLAATGGADRESIEHAVRFAPGGFRAQRRAVTADDYEALALTFKGVGKVRARAAGWNLVTLLVAPAGGGHVSDVLELGLKGFLEDKRMLSQLVEVQEATYVQILVTAEISIESYYVSDDVVAGVRQAVSALLAFEAVSFGQPVYLSSFYEASAEVPGVTFVNITQFRRAGGRGPAVEPSGRILLSPDELPTVPDDPAYAGGLQVVLVGAGGG